MFMLRLSGGVTMKSFLMIAFGTPFFVVGFVIGFVVVGLKAGYIAAHEITSRWAHE